MKKQLQFNNYGTKTFQPFFGLLLLALILFLAQSAGAEQLRSIEDAKGRTLQIPENVERVICSGPGALRLLTYLQAQERVVAVDSIEKRNPEVNLRPYAEANPRFQELPMFGQHRGQDNPELIAALDPQPQVILRTYPEMGKDPDNTQQKTGIPVITMDYGNLTYEREELNESLRLMGRVLGKKERAEEVIEYMNQLQEDLQERTADVSQEEAATAYIAGVASRGTHGVRSTNPTYPPFRFLQVDNAASELASEDSPLSQATVSQEKILSWDPEVIFLDTASLHQEGMGNALQQLRQDPAYRTLTAVQKGRVYGVFPYNFYTNNFESILANSYYVGKVLYPDRFRDVEPMEKAQEISEFLNGAPAFDSINSRLENPAFTRMEVD